MMTAAPNSLNGREKVFEETFRSPFEKPTESDALKVFYDGVNGLSAVGGNESLNIFCNKCFRFLCINKFRKMSEQTATGAV